MEEQLTVDELKESITSVAVSDYNGLRFLGFMENGNGMYPEAFILSRDEWETWHNIRGLDPVAELKAHYARCLELLSSSVVG